MNLIYLFIDVSIQFIIELIRRHGVLAVVLGMVVEEVFVPIPSPFIPMAAGAILIESNSFYVVLTQVFFVIAIPASIASVISSYFVYFLVFFGGKPVLDKYGKYLDISWNEVNEFEKHFNHNHEKYYVAIFRALPIVPLSLISGAAGLFRMDWKKYGIWSFIGMIPRNFFLALIGWKLKDGFLIIAERINTLSKLVLVLFIAIIIVYILYKNLKDIYKLILRI